MHGGTIKNVIQPVHVFGTQYCEPGFLGFFCSDNDQLSVWCAARAVSASLFNPLGESFIYMALNLGFAVGSS